MANIFSFDRDSGKNDAREDGNIFTDLFRRKGHEAADKVEAEKKGERVILRGRVPRRDVAERMVIEAGNTRGVSEVEDQLEIEPSDKPAPPPARFYTVKSGDTLSKIAREAYGDASKYMLIFEANKPTLSDPDEIYPGQVLRIPAENKGAMA